MKIKFTQLRWLVTMLLLVTAMVTPLKAAAQTTFESGDFTYEVISADDMTVGVKSYSGNGGDVAIPQTVSDGTNTYTVTKIMDKVFMSNSALTGISMPETIIEIGAYAFYSCSNLTGDITINAPIQKIGTSAFNNCYNDRLTLKFTNLQNAHIGNGAFMRCIGLSSLGGTISYIGEGAFARCTKLTGSLTLSADITSIGNYAFDNCKISDITCHASVPAPAKDITIYVKGAEAPYIHAWIVVDELGNRIKPAGEWPGTKMTESTTINGENFWYYTISGYSSFNYILNNGNISDMSFYKQTDNLSADGDRYHGEGTSWTDITDQMIPASTDITLAANSGSTDYWGTYSNMSSAARLSTVNGTSLKVYDAKVSGGVLTLIKRTGSDVAKGEGVLVWSNGANVRATAITDKLNATVNTDLVATPPVAQTINADGGYKLYRLTYNNVSAKEGLGFYLSLVKDGNNNVIENSVGSQLKATPGKAYLNVSTEAATTPATAALARSFVFPGDDETTGIGEIVIEGDAGISGSANANDRIYNLQGQQVTAPLKGLYIKNNKKVVIK